MTTEPLPWNFEPCSPEGATDPQGNEWPHAVRGRKPAGRVVYGYGYTEPAAWHDAEQKAQQYDAREMVGQRGEIKPVQFQIESAPGVPITLHSGFKPYGTIQISTSMSEGWPLK